MGYHSYIDTCATELVQVIGQFVPLESGRTLPAGRLCRDLEIRCSDISKRFHSPFLTVLGVNVRGQFFDWMEGDDGSLLVFLGRLFQSCKEPPCKYIMDGYKNSGCAIFSHLNGEFMFSLYDSERGALFLVKDHFGSRPIYYRWLEKSIFFSTSLMYLIRLGPPLTIDKTALVDLLLDGKIGSSRTLLSEIRKVRAGSYLEVRRDGFEEKTYWDPAELIATADSRRLDADEYLDALKESVRERIEDLEAPFYSYLSGGTDSTLCASLLSELLRERKSDGSLVTLSVDIDEKGWGEGELARTCSRYIGSVHRESLLTQMDFLQRIAEAIEVAEVCSKGDGGFPYFFAALLASREGAGTVFSGDGADGGFGGRPSLIHSVVAHVIHSILRRRKATWRGMRLVLAYVLKQLQTCVSGKTRGLRNLARTGVESIDPAFFLRRRRETSSRFWRRLVSTRFVSEEEWKRALESLERDLEPVSGMSSFNAYRFLSFSKSDPSRFRALWNWHNSAKVTPTYPFMDRRVCEMILRRSPDAFYTQPRTKDFLRAILERRGFPRHITERGKTGFFVPLVRWYSGSLSDFARSTITEGLLVKNGLIDTQRVMELFNDVHHNWSAIGTLVNLELWLRVVTSIQEEVEAGEVKITCGGG